MTKDQERERAVRITILSVLLLAGCASGDDIKMIQSWQRHDYKMMALDSQATNERINTWAERAREVEARVRYLEKVLAPLDPDGLLEDPDLYSDEAEAKRFYRLHEKTECGR